MPLLNVQEAADRLKVCPTTIYQMCAQRKLPHVRVGLGRGAIRIDEEALADYLARATVKPEPAAEARSAPRKLKHLKV